jgi:ring-1,2-phenylacetyl-CoA epoxidase subunit PaaE
MFVEELLALKNRYLSRLSLHFLMSAEPSDVEVLNGHLDAAKLEQFGRAVDLACVDEFFVCGPAAMLDGVTAALRGCGVRAPIHVESFGGPRAAPATAAGAVMPAGDATTTEVTVVMDGRRRRFVMAGAGESVLEAAERAGLDLPFSCRSGVCSTCRARVLGGEVGMQRNQALEAWELAAGYVLCCQARPLSGQLLLSFDEK